MIIGMIWSWIDEGCDLQELLEILIIFGVVVGIPAVLVRLF